MLLGGNMPKIQVSGAAIDMIDAINDLFTPALHDGAKKKAEDEGAEWVSAKHVIAALLEVDLQGIADQLRK